MGKHLDNIESAPLHELRALQSYRLSQTVRRVYKNVPFYRRRFDEMGLKPEDIRSVDDLHKLPFTSKADLRDNYPYGLFATPMDNVVRIHASSGTTGKQVVVGYTERDLRDWGNITARALVAAGGSKHDFIHVSYGYGLFTGGLGLNAGAEYLHATAIPASVGNTQRQIQIMQDFGSSIICCTPSYLLYLGESIRDMGIDPGTLKLKAALCGAEPWSESMRRQIEGLMQIRVFDIYGLSEVMGPGVSFECGEQTGMHINEDMFIPEIVDPDTGECLPDGESGELVFTCITKEAFPLLRYRTRDITMLTREECSCGRTFVKMKRTQGRTDDMLIIRGVNVFPSQVETALLEQKLTAPFYQLIVDREGTLDTLEVVVEMHGDMPFDTVRIVEDTQRRLRKAIESTLGIAVKVSLVTPKTLERSEGKSKRVIDKRGI